MVRFPSRIWPPCFSALRVCARNSLCGLEREREPAGICPRDREAALPDRMGITVLSPHLTSHSYYCCNVCEGLSRVSHSTFGRTCVALTPFVLLLLGTIS